MKIVPKYSMSLQEVFASGCTKVYDGPRVYLAQKAWPGYYLAYKVVPEDEQ